MLKSIRKFIIAGIGLALTAGWIDSDVANGLIAVTTAALVWLVPNE